MLTLLLCGCVSAPRKGEAPAPWAQRLAALRAVNHFELDGRLAASNGQTGFSAGLRWKQQDDVASIDLTAPLGFGAAHVEQRGDALTLTTSKGVTLDRAAASDELAATLGFEPPLTSLRYWILGASDPAGSAQESLDAQQRLVHLEQGGWQVDYTEYVLVGSRWLPRRMSVTHEGLRLRLVIDTWRL